MAVRENLAFFFDPKSVAVIGASNRLFSWGNLIFSGILTHKYPGRLYPINPNVRDVLGISAYSSLTDVPGEVDVVFIAIPPEELWGALDDCGKKGVKGIVIITAGFSETMLDKGKKEEEKIALFAKSKGIRVIGPNVSGMFNLHRNYYAAGGNAPYVNPSKLTFVSQGGYAVSNLINRSYSKGQGVGKFVHTGNEADLQCIDFLEFFEKDPQTEVILMYIEGLRKPREFLEIARKITQEKPIIVYKAGKSQDGARAATSHTGVMAGSSAIYDGLFEQAGCIQAPHFESVLELGHAFTFYPPLRGQRIGITTMGGSWGVMLTDQICKAGLEVPELSASLQRKLRDIGMPYRASTRNPVDMGAAGTALDVNERVSIIEAILADERIDGVIVHGLGRLGMEFETLPEELRKGLREEEEILQKGVELMRSYEKPLVIGSHMTHLESVSIKKIVNKGIPVFTRLEDMAGVLIALYRYYHLIRNVRKNGL